MSDIRRKVFISYHQPDEDAVDDFIADFGHVFIPKILGSSYNDDFVNSTNPDYVMSEIRRLYLGDSSVTIVLIGRCTHSRRYVDWEIKSSLRQGGYTPNGLIGITLPSMGNRAHLPRRFQRNFESNGAGYAQFRSYPATASELSSWIEEAFRDRVGCSHLINNSQDMMKYNGRCEECGVTH